MCHLHLDIWHFFQSWQPLHLFQFHCRLESIARNLGGVPCATNMKYETLLRPHTAVQSPSSTCHFFGSPTLVNDSCSSGAFQNAEMSSGCFWHTLSRISAAFLKKDLDALALDFSQIKPALDDVMSCEIPYCIISHELSDLPWMWRTECADEISSLCFTNCSWFQHRL